MDDLSETTDLFENPELLPSEVLAVLQKFQDKDNTYENCEDLLVELNNVGYTFEFGLDAIPFDLQKIEA